MNVEKNVNGTNFKEKFSAEGEEGEIISSEL